MTLTLKKPFPDHSAVRKPVKVGSKRPGRKHHPHHGSRGGRPPGSLNHLDSPLDVRDGTMCVMPASSPADLSNEPAQCIADQDGSAAMTLVVEKIISAVDGVEELNGSGIVLQVPGNDPLLLTPPSHPSGLDTYVVATVEPSAAVQQEQSWWDRWNGIVLNCGGAAISWGGVGVEALAEPLTLGGVTPLMVLNIAGATATSAQCGLAVAKMSSNDFAEYIQGPDGQWINTADVLLDVVSLVGGVAGAAQAIRSGSKLLKASKYAAVLEGSSKGTLVKKLAQLEKMEGDVEYIRKLFGVALKKGLVQDPVGRLFSNNLLKRALPLIVKQLRGEVIAGLASVIGQAISTASSAYGGSGSRNLGLVKITIQILQESIGGQPSAPAPK